MPSGTAAMARRMARSVRACSAADRPCRSVRPVSVEEFGDATDRRPRWRRPALPDRPAPGAARGRCRRGSPSRPRFHSPSRIRRVGQNADAFLEQLPAIRRPQRAADIGRMRDAAGEADELAAMKDRRHHREVRQMARGEPGVVGDDGVARPPGLDRETWRETPSWCAAGCRRTRRCRRCSPPRCRRCGPSARSRSRWTRARWWRTRCAAARLPPRRRSRSGDSSRPRA